MKINLLSLLFNICVRIIFVTGMIYVAWTATGPAAIIATILGYGYLGICVSSAFMSKMKEEFYQMVLRDMQAKINKVNKLIKEAKEKNND